MEKAEQLISFDGMLFEGRSGIKNVTPTDLDGFIQLDVYRTTILFELKYEGDSPVGQKDAMSHMVDCIWRGGENAIAFIAVHKTPLGEMIYAKDSIVTSFYHPLYKRWINLNGKNRPTLYSAIESHLRFVWNHTKPEERCKTSQPII